MKHLLQICLLQYLVHLFVYYIQNQHCHGYVLIYFLIKWNKKKGLFLSFTLTLLYELIQRALNPRENVRIRAVPGGPAPEMVEIARENIKLFLDEEFERHGI